MKQKLIALFLCLALMAVLPFQVFAAESEPQWVVDHADLLLQSEEAELTQQIDSLRRDHEIDVVIVTIWDLDGKTAQEYADDFYDQNGYGYGDDHSGILLLLAMETREWYMSTCGEAIYIFTDYGLDEMGEAILPYLSGGDYYGAFDRWLDEIPYYCEAYQGGSPVDGYVPPDAYYPEGGDEIIYYQPLREPNYLGNFLIALLIGAVVALIVVLIMRSRMNTAKFQKNAGNYLKNGSYHLNTRRDMFLYSRVTKTPKPQNNGSSRGGSSVHRSSGGRSHGGRGGRF